MHCLLAVFLFHLFLLSRNSILGDSLLLQSIKDDHNELEIRCPSDCCQFSQNDSLESQTCHCGKQCVLLGTCCFDSPYANVPQQSKKPTCRLVPNGKYYFIVHKCSLADSVWASQCNDESIGDDDLQKLLPVTSLMTNITYKNYYCFRCYEVGEQFKFWTLKIERNSLPSRFSGLETEKLRKQMSFIYNKTENTVMASYSGEIGYFRVVTKLKIPPEIKNLTHVCEPGVISDCSEEWSDEEIRKKCHAYMAIKEVKTIGFFPIKYKNMHCALCNFENLNSLSCRKSFRGDTGLGVLRGSSVYTIGEGTFSLAAIFNINPSVYSDDEQSKMNDKQCPDGERWNPYAKKCKKLKCLKSGYIASGDTCVKA